MLEVHSVAHAWDIQEPATTYCPRRCSPSTMKFAPLHNEPVVGVHLHWLQMQGCEELDKGMDLSLLEEGEGQW